MQLLLQRHAICVTMFVCPILITQCENSDGYKEVSNRRLTDKIAEKAKQTVVDIGEVMKSQQSVLECNGKKFAKFIDVQTTIFSYFISVVKMLLKNVVGIFDIGSRKHFDFWNMST
ncbi:unnamed protein product [Acanthocheilonema viteae]|uniref:Uncharacterized protein n=1 Tax=Acanthocheilonema viteae TaxID=6277 RepID=A0A498SII0_ACAVI|nr:unnamed protein product [Acanthocheilonema viteae]